MTTFHIWVFLTLVLASLPSLLRLPPWAACITVAGSVLHFNGPWRRGHGVRIFSLVLLAGTVGGIWLSFESWFSGRAVLSFFVCVVFLKWAESKTRRDFLLLIFAAVILAAVGALYFENLLSLVHMMVVIFFLTVSLVAIHMDERKSGAVFLLRCSAQLFMLGLPVMLLLFLTFPRIPGPLWDLGLAFGLPVKALMNRGSGEFGKATTLQPGGIQRAGQDNENVLVAEFEGAVPFKSRLYWRGAVFWDYDGENWTLPDTWNNRTRLLKRAIRSKQKLERELRFKDNPVRYTLRVMPNGGRWLYGLDFPAAPAPEAFISDEFQLLSIREIDDHEPKLQMVSYLDYNAGSGLTDEQKKRGLAFPASMNPRLHALGQDLAVQYKDPESIVHQALRYLAANNFRYDAGHVIEPGINLLDRFFFDEKRGGAEYLAGSFVMLMRAAGVPARLVSGYRGGTIIALTNFVIVKRSDAHAWVEVWQDHKGWSRVEPKDIVLPPEKNPDQIKKEENAKPAGQVEMQADEDKPVKIRDSAGAGKAVKKNGPSDVPVKSWSLPDLGDLFGAMKRWVIRYDPHRQMELFKGAGTKKRGWLDLLALGMAGVTGLLCLYLAVAWWRGRVRVDPLTKTWMAFLRHTEKLGLKKDNSECPRDYLVRVCSMKPELSAAADDIIGRYIDLRYGENPSPEAVNLLERQVRRFVSMT